MSSRFFKRIAAPGLLGLALLAVVLLAAIGGGNSDASANNGVRGLDRAIAAQEANTASLFGIQGVVGTGVGLDDDGNAVVVVFTDIPGVGGIPSEVDGVATSVRVSGPFVALPKGGNGGGPGGGAWAVLEGDIGDKIPAKIIIRFIIHADAFEIIRTGAGTEPASTGCLCLSSVGSWM